MPPGDGGRLDQFQGGHSPRPHPSQTQPEQTVTQAEASIRTSRHAELVAEGKILEEEVPTRGEGRPERRDGPEDLTHRL
jgi:hypothetical protein